MANTSTHSKLTTIKLMSTSAGVTGDISAWTDNSQLTRGADVHDITGYGKDDHVNTPGLLTGSFTCGGWYDTSASTGTSAILPPLLGADDVIVVRRVQGAGSGLPHQFFDAVLNSYVESSPVADVVRWTADFTVSDAVTDTTQ